MQTARVSTLCFWLSLWCSSCGSNTSDVAPATGGGSGGSTVGGSSGAAGSASLGGGGTVLSDGAAGASPGSGGGSSDGGQVQEGAVDAPTRAIRTLSLTTYVDKVKGGWAGQMAAGRWMGSTEYNPNYVGKLIPTTAIPAWTNNTINDGFGPEADETWSELPYLDTLVKVGVLATWVDFGNSWRDSPFPDGTLYSANLAARNNLRKGMKAPDSGYFKVTGGNAENQTWQMMSNWSGMIAPGLVNTTIDINWRSGHVALFGDAINGGVMVSTMQTTAFFAKSVDEIIEAGRQAVPMGSRYRAMVEDVLTWCAQNPNDYPKVWQLTQDKWGSRANYRHCNDATCVYTLDAKINGAYILMGLFYGKGDWASSITYAARGGQDGDCTANDVGSIIGTYLGLSKLDGKYSQALSTTAKFENSPFTFANVIDATTEVARKIVSYRGGTVTGAGNNEVWTIPDEGPITPPILEQWPLDESAPPPVLSAPTPKLSGRTLTIDAAATSAKGPLSYQWYFGDLTHSASSAAGTSTHLYERAGTYLVIGYATDATGNTSWKSVDLTVP